MGIADRDRRPQTQQNEPLHDDDNKGWNINDVVYSFASTRLDPLPGPRRYLFEPGESSTSRCPDSTSRCPESTSCCPDDNNGRYVLEPGESSTSRCPDSTSRCPDDNNGRYVPELGEILKSRYKIMSKMGEGTFATVLECWDCKKKEIVAIKVVRNVRKYRRAARDEIEVLRYLAKHDKAGKRGCLQWKRSFSYQKHVCIVCEKLGPSLYDLRRKNNDRPFPVDFVQDISRQLLKVVAYMHDLKLTHTDIKLENILLVSSKYKKIPDKNSSSPGYMDLPVSRAIKLIDFGNATHEIGCHSSLFSTIFNCAPEVILGLGWSYPCDLWSVGCILVQLCSGHALFQADNNVERLEMMRNVLGPIPKYMIISYSKCRDRFRKWLNWALAKGSIQDVERSTLMESHHELSKAAKNLERLASERASEYFRGKLLRWPEKSSNSERTKEVANLPCLRDLIEKNVDHSAGALIDLLKRLLTFDPVKRISAKEALKHEFFRERT